VAALVAIPLLQALFLRRCAREAEPELRAALEGLGWSVIPGGQSIRDNAVLARLTIGDAARPYRCQPLAEKKNNQSSWFAGTIHVQARSIPFTQGQFVIAPLEHFNGLDLHMAYQRSAPDHNNYHRDFALQDMIHPRPFSNRPLDQALLDELLAICREHKEVTELRIRDGYLSVHYHKGGRSAWSECVAITSRIRERLCSTIEHGVAGERGG